MSLDLLYITSIELHEASCIGNISPECSTADDCMDRDAGRSNSKMPSFMRPMLQEEAACSTWSGRRSGLSDGLLGGSIRSSASSSVGPLYQPMLSDFSIMLSPWKPEIGTKFTCARVCRPALTVPRNQQMILPLFPAGVRPNGGVRVP